MDLFCIFKYISCLVVDLECFFFGDVEGFCMIFFLEMDV